MALELITRAGCHLCDEALAAMQELGYQPVQVDVDADPRLSEQFDFRVPVILLDGVIVAEGRVSKERLADVLVKG